MSKKLRPNIKRLNLKRSERAKKKMLKKRTETTAKPSRKVATGTFKILVEGERMEYQVGPSGYVPSGGKRQYI